MSNQRQGYDIVGTGLNTHSGHTLLFLLSLI